MKKYLDKLLNILNHLYTTDNSIFPHGLGQRIEEINVNTDTIDFLSKNLIKHGNEWIAVRNP